VVLETGELRCWSSLAGSFWTFEPMRQANWPRKRATRAVAVGDSPVCAVDDAGHVDCFWSDEQGLPDQAADASWATTGDGPHPIAGIDGATAVGVGLGRDAFAYGFGCVLRSGEVLCWGDNASGELGNGTVQRSLTPTRVLAPR
jgi:serine/threonine-protein kinase